MSTNLQPGQRPLLDRPSLRHLKDQATDLLKTAAKSITDGTTCQAHRSSAFERRGMACTSVAHCFVWRRVSKGRPERRAFWITRPCCNNNTRTVGQFPKACGAIPRSFLPFETALQTRRATLLRHSASRPDRYIWWNHPVRKH
jgi:hypothetical protein